MEETFEQSDHISIIDYPYGHISCCVYTYHFFFTFLQKIDKQFSNVEFSNKFFSLTIK